ncbi:MAG: peptide-methionine (R)-S-oxide reductase MsrB [Desulfovibrionaceae bacterium]|nr:peptide-methionine (R)-S-oxide reductase MsrB [Desulfovibrionaceae bacterium]MBF0512935.1 peptide-methionine (R)-S-oxide reductase MsrB [Desulfovibrionaceae bacterium]
MNKAAPILFALVLALAYALVPAGPVRAAEKEGAPMQSGDTAAATFAGGCFWCVESDFMKVPGVISVVSGYTGGQEKNPTYEQVSAHRTGHLESVQVHYDPAKVSYEYLLDYFWRHIDPTDDGGQFCDRGEQYRSAIFYQGEAQRLAAEKSKAELDKSGVLHKPVTTTIRPLTVFYPAEDYHQNYAGKNPLRYEYYRFSCGRDKTVKAVWSGASEPPPPVAPVAPGAIGATGAPWVTGSYRKPPESELRKTLTPMQFEVTQKEGTEPPFKNEYDHNQRPGLYVDILTGEPLFSSTDKFDSGTGWPSFTRPLEPGNIVEKEDRHLFSTRTEIRSKLGDNHIGHVFPDGPPPTGLRYCMNSAALRFVPKGDLEKEGYGKYLTLFAK